MTDAEMTAFPWYDRLEDDPDQLDFMIEDEPLKVLDNGQYLLF